MKARTHQAGTVKFGRLNMKSRKGSMNFHKEGAALGRRRGAQSVVSNERHKRSKLLSKLNNGIRSTTSTLTGRDQRDVDERIGDTSKQLLQSGAKRAAQTGVKAGMGAARKTTGWVARTSARGIHHAASSITRKSASIVAQKLAQKAAQRTAKQTAGMAARKSAQQAAKKAAATAARTSATITRQTVAMATRAASAIAAAVSSMSMPFIVGVVSIVAVIAMVTSLFSWLPGAANDQNTQTSSVNYPITDDYPYKGHYNDGTSPLGYEYGNCTDFVAWRINRDAGTTAAPWRYKWAQLTPQGETAGNGVCRAICPAGVSRPRRRPATSSPYPPVWPCSGPTAALRARRIHRPGVGRQRAHRKLRWRQVLPNQSHHRPARLIYGFRQRRDQAQPRRPSIFRILGGHGHGREKLCEERIERRQSIQLPRAAVGSRIRLARRCGERFQRRLRHPQALPGSKMAAAGADWKTNGVTQVKWGLSYISSRPDYRNPCGAWAKWQSRSPHWY